MNLHWRYLDNMQASEQERLEYEQEQLLEYERERLEFELECMFDCEQRRLDALRAREDQMREEFEAAEQLRREAEYEAEFEVVKRAETERRAEMEQAEMEQAEVDVVEYRSGFVTFGGGIRERL